MVTTNISPAESATTTTTKMEQAVRVTRTSNSSSPVEVNVATTKRKEAISVSNLILTNKGTTLKVLSIVEEQTQVGQGNSKIRMTLKKSRGHRRTKVKELDVLRVIKVPSISVPR